MSNVEYRFRIFLEGTPKKLRKTIKEFEKECKKDKKDKGALNV